MSERPTPETDAVREDIGMGCMMVDSDFARKLERQRDEAREDATNYYAKIGELEQERDEAREKIERQAERIRYLEGATNHATGTPLSVALRERDEARERAERYRAAFCSAKGDLVPQVFPWEDSK